MDKEYFFIIIGNLWMIAGHVTDGIVSSVLFALSIFINLTAVILLLRSNDENN